MTCKSHPTHVDRAEAKRSCCREINLFILATSRYHHVLDAKPDMASSGTNRCGDNPSDDRNNPLKTRQHFRRRRRGEIERATTNDRRQDHHSGSCKKIIQVSSLGQQLEIAHCRLRVSRPGQTTTPNEHGWKVLTV
jgi:hypothetical protein